MLEGIPRSHWKPKDWYDAIRGRQDGYSSGRSDGYVSQWNIFEDFSLDEILFYGDSWDDKEETESEFYRVAYSYGYDEGFEDGFAHGDAFTIWE